jgi:uncharacterized protein (TIRG00374 family)
MRLLSAGETRGTLPVAEEGRLQKKRNWMVGVAISGVALVVAFWGVKPERLFTTLSGANYAYLVPAALAIFLGLLARARSWQILLGKRIVLRRSFEALNEGYLLNTVLPFRLGELVRAYIISQDLNSGAGSILATVLVERIIDSIVSLIGLLVALPFVIIPDSTQNLIWGVIAILLLVVFAVIVLLSQRRKLIRFLRKLPGSGFWGLHEAADDFIEGLEIIRESSRIIMAAFWSLIAWATTWFQLWVLLHMFGIEGSIIVSLFVSGIIAFGAAIPSSPGALGVFELSAIAGLLVFGYSHENALGFAVVAHLLQLIMTGVFGGWALAREGQTVLGLAAKTQNLFRKVQNRTIS